MSKKHTATEIAQCVSAFTHAEILERVSTALNSDEIISSLIVVPENEELVPHLCIDYFDEEMFIVHMHKCPHFFYDSIYQSFRGTGIGSTPFPEGWEKMDINELARHLAIKLWHQRAEVITIV